MKVAMLSPLQVEILDDERARLLAPFTVALSSNTLPEKFIKFTEHGFEITVPAGFETDFSSVPRIPLAYWLTGGKAKKAAVVHDWLYSLGAGSRIWCDDVYCALAKLGRISGWRRGLMWAGVRLGGGSHFGRTRA